MKRRILDGDFLDRLDAAELVLKTAMSGFFGGTRKSRSYGNTVEFADFREYNAGDDIRRIDWNVFARTEKYFNIALEGDIRQCLKEGNLSRLNALKIDNAGGILIEVLESKDKTFTAARMQKYCPEGYKPETEWVVF